jgi:hypothetical protein
VFSLTTPYRDFWEILLSRNITLLGVVFLWDLMVLVAISAYIFRMETPTLTTW